MTSCMLALHMQLAAARTEHELRVYPAEPRRMAGNGGRLTEEEIGIVEG